MKMKALRLRMGTNEEADGEGNKGVRTGEEGKGAYYVCQSAFCYY